MCHSLPLTENLHSISKKKKGNVRKIINKNILIKNQKKKKPHHKQSTLLFNHMERKKSMCQLTLLIGERRKEWEWDIEAQIRSKRRNTGLL